MAKLARFPVEAFERGQLPHICALSGEPTDDHMNVTVESDVSGLWAFLGFIPFLIVWSNRKRARGQLPLTENVYEVVRARRAQVKQTLLVGCGLVLAGLLVSLAPVAPGWTVGFVLLGFAVLFVGSVIVQLRHPLRGLRVDSSGRWVELPNAADTFADAVSGAMKAGRI
jgi:hypothetical protein